MADCSLWITVARTDLSFMMQTIPHLVRMCNYPFAERVLAIDTALLSGEKRLRPNLGTINDLRSYCSELLEKNVIDRTVDIDYSESYKKWAYKKHFGRCNIKATHNWKGYPILGSIYCIEECRTDYLLHFDSDMLLYQKPGYSWVGEGIKALRDNPKIFYVRPCLGPQNERKNLYRDVYSIQKNADDLYILPGLFASRCYLIDRRRFDTLLPMLLMWAKRQGRIKDKLPKAIIDSFNSFTGSGLLESWEVMVAQSMKEKSFVRADIADDRAWTLHPNDHGADFIRMLPKIIGIIEKGGYPKEQTGKYDLQLEFWR